MIAINNEPNVLVVDNNPVLVKVLTSFLEKEGCQVKTARNGLEALDMLEAWSVNIVFTDLVMPLVEGDVLCGIIKSKEQYRDIFVTILSAIAKEDLEKIFAEVPCDLCFVKGTMQEMRQQVRKTLDDYKRGYRRVVKPEIDSANAPSTAQPQLVEDSVENTITRELLREKDHLRHIIKNLSEGILELNSKGKIVRANSAIAKIFLQSQEEMIGKGIAEVICWNQYQAEVEDWLAEELVGKGADQFEIKENDPLSINDKMLSGKLSVVENDEGCFGVCIFHDITRQYLAEKHKQEVDAAMELMKKMEALRGMAGGVAHDFNNLLTAICGNLDIVLADPDLVLPEEKLSLIENAKKASLMAVDLTRTISCFSSFGIVHRMNHEFSDLVSHCLDKFFRKNVFPYDVQLIKERLIVKVDLSEIELVFENILENSLEALGRDQKTISILSEHVKFSEPHLVSGQYIPAGNYAKVCIVDEGPGIKKKHLTQVFDAYFSSKERSSVKGMGLGLAVVYSVMRNHGGYVVVDSIEGKGTTVSLLFPVFEEKEESKNPVKIEERTVLLVEPESQLRELGQIMLEYLDYNTVAVETPERGMEYLYQMTQQNGQGTSMLVFLDLNGRTEIDIRRYCMKIKDIDASIDIIGVCGVSVDPLLKNCKEYGMSNSLVKPYTFDSLKHVLNTVGKVR